VVGRDDAHTGQIRTPNDVTHNIGNERRSSGQDGLNRDLGLAADDSTELLEKAIGGQCLSHGMERVYD
jgi:hypothetical protein